MRTLRLSRPLLQGHDVLQCQKYLHKHGLTFIPLDSSFGPETVIGVRAIQGMYNMKASGIVDRDTWNLLASPPQQFPTLVNSTRRRFMDACLRMMGIPYCHGSDDPRIGVDPLGFLSVALKEVGWYPEYPLTSYSGLHGFLASEITPIDLSEAIPSDLCVYYGRDGRATHLLVLLNDKVGVGPIGGNASTITPEMAMRRKACVKIKAVNYRDYRTFRVSNPA